MPQIEKGDRLGTEVDIPPGFRKVPTREPRTTGPRFPGMPVADGDGPWTRYQQQALDELNRRNEPRDLFASPRFAGEPVNEGPWTKYQQGAPRDLFATPGTAHQFEITAPDGKKYRVGGESAEGAVNALRTHLGGAGKPLHPEFDASAIPGYDPSTGMVERGKSDSGILAGLTGTLEGIPIAGPLLQSGTEGVAAGIGSALTGDPYSKVHREMSGMVDTAQKANPITTNVANVGGAVVGTIPMIMAAPQAFGVGAGNFLARSAASAITGAGIGGADAAVRSGGDPSSMVTGSLAGLATGAAGPGLSALVGAGYRATADFLARRGAAKIGEMTPQAVGQLMKAMEADGIPANEVQQRLAALGPNGMLADLGANLQQTAAGLVVKPGLARAIVQDAIRTRDAAANARISGTLDDTLGPSPIPSQISAGIEANQRALAPEYRQVFQNASPVDTNNIARYLDREVQTLRGEAQRGLASVRRMLNRTGTDQLETSPVTLLETRKAVDGMLEAVQDSNARNALQTARQAIDDQLRASVPGIKEVDAKFAELARQRDALQRGQQVLDGGRTAPRPAELAQDVQDGALPQGMQIGPSAVPVRLREGARAEIERIVGTNANDRVALQRLIKGEGDWNRDRLATLFGRERADRIIALLDAERTFADTSNFVTRNSATAARQQAVRGLGSETGDGFGVREGYMAGGAFGAARSAAVTSAERIIEALRGAGREADHAGLARGLTSNKHDRIVRALMRGDRSQRAEPEKISNLARALMLGSATTFAGR